MVLTKGIFFHYGQELKVVVDHTAQKENKILKLEADLRKARKGLKTVGQAVPKRVVLSKIPAEMGRLLISGRTQTCRPSKLMPKHYKPASECVMNDSECLPRGVLSFTRQRSLPTSV